MSNGNRCSRARDLISAALERRSSDEKGVNFRVEEAIVLIPLLAELSHSETMFLLKWIKNEVAGYASQNVSQELANDLAVLFKAIEIAKSQGLVTSVSWDLLSWSGTCELGDLLDLLGSIGDPSRENQKDSSAEEDKTGETPERRNVPIGFCPNGGGNGESGTSSKPEKFGFC